ncbi:MAG: prepilin-type N-terminal cleavage/methylation domain-containing protein [Nannocystis sp.]|nr:prepilin-type N-terminal cleavage/methylation domain-containing protein [Nannocystis sp.]MBA3548996.1 prepilin-type N-terminal cleavage/methylation domain-containing protein [Nannocystis sp.]
MTTPIATTRLQQPPPPQPSRAGGRVRARLGASGSAGRRARRSRGMTLIEVLIVLAICGLVVGSVIGGLGASRQAEVTRATNQMANTVRFAFNKARVTGSYYRLLINLDDGSFSMQRGDDRMYLPSTDRYGRIVTIDPNRVKEREERDRRAEENYNRSLQARVLGAVKGPAAGRAATTTPIGQAPGAAKPGAVPQPGIAGAAAKPGAPGAVPGAPAPGVKPDQYAVAPKAVPRRKPPMFGAFDDDNSLSELKKPFKLPKQIKVSSVQTADDPKPIVKGEASIYFFPQGHTQRAHIQIEDLEHPDNAFTIVIHPLTGRVEIKEGKVNLGLENDPTAVMDDLKRKQTRRTF